MLQTNQGVIGYELDGQAQNHSNTSIVLAEYMFFGVGNCSVKLTSLCAGMPLRDTLLDQFTLTEVLRLHLMSSGARANSKNARFRYQQRGGYSSLDDPGLELRKQESGLLKKLQNGNIFDFSPGWAGFSLNLLVLGLDFSCQTQHSSLISHKPAQLRLLIASLCAGVESCLTFKLVYISCIF